jgi:tRNA (guanine37-N1)-methyltransferase
MHFDIFTLFPAMFAGPLDDSIVQRAREAGIVSLALHNIRDYAEGKHAITDDYPYGGGGGMVMKPDPIFAAIEDVLGSPPACSVILLTPQGRLFTQSLAQELAFRELESHGERPRMALLCGRYEGVDERVRQYLVSDEISIGDYVLTGGELPALVVIDAVTRLIPGALGDPAGALEDSHASGLLEHPHYTRPADFRGWTVPEVLLSGDHARIARWRRQQALQRTWERRPDLLARAALTEDDRKFLEKLEAESRD